MNIHEANDLLTPMRPDGIELYETGVILDAIRWQVDQGSAVVELWEDGDVIIRLPKDKPSKMVMFSPEQMQWLGTVGICAERIKKIWDEEQGN